MTPRFLKRLWRLLPGGLAAIVVLGLQGSGALTSLENACYRWRFHWRGTLPWDERIALITIDDATLAELGQFPLSRQLYTQLLEKLSDAKSSVVAFNILFIEPSPADKALAAAMTKQGHVVIVSGLDNQGQILDPSPPLMAAAIASGHGLQTVERDGLVHMIQPLGAQQKALGITLAEVYSLIQAPIQLPPMDEPLLINWPGKMADLPQYSLVDVLSGKVPPQIFDHKIIIVGMTAMGSDALLTPYDENPPGSGVLVHAAVLDNLFQQRYLHQVDMPWLWALLLVSMPAMSYCLLGLRLRWQLLITIGGSLGWLGISMLVFYFTYLLPMAFPMLLIGLTGATSIVGQRLRESIALKQLLNSLWQYYQQDAESLTDSAAISPFVPNDLGSEVRKLALLAVSLSRIQTTQAAISQMVPLGLLAADEHDQIWFCNRLAHQWLGVSIDQSLSPALVPHWLEDNAWQRMREELLRGEPVAPIELQQELSWLEFRFESLDGTKYLEFSLESVKHGFLILIEDITHRKVVELHLRSLNADLQDEVQQRSQELESTNTTLQRAMLDRQKIQHELAYKALYDELTGLPNRYHLMSRLKIALQAIQTSGDHVAVLFLDCDRFKLVNDSYGHIVGDELLKAIAKRLKNCIAQTDLVARFGGDEFTVVAKIQTSKAAINIAQRIRQTLKAPFLIQDRHIYTGCSIGIVIAGTGYTQAEEILRDADTAMYRAKRSGIGYTLFEPEMHVQVRQSLQLETDLRKALQRQEFIVYYQPIFNLGNKQIAGFEALLRWQHQTAGLISPCQFIPIAEEIGMIVSIGQWVMQEACNQLKCWQQSDRLSPNAFMSINLSANQFSEDNLVSQVDQVLQISKLDSQHLKLEITESSIISNVDLAIRTCHALQERGICLSIDDFGTGYSSLSYLHCFPIDVLKIDRSFTQRMVEDPKKLNLLRAITMFTQHLEMTMIAEGIETKEQLDLLSEMGCPLGQGYFLCPPKDRHTIEGQFLNSSIKPWVHA